MREQISTAIERMTEAQVNAHGRETGYMLAQANLAGIITGLTESLSPAMATAIVDVLESKTAELAKETA